MKLEGGCFCGVIRYESNGNPGSVTPRDHVYPYGKLPWVRVADGLPTYPRSRADGR